MPDLDKSQTSSAYSENAHCSNRYRLIVAPMKFKFIPLSLPRRYMADLSHMRLSVPLGTIKRTINIAGLREARQQAAISIPWTILFAKAYGLLAAETPALRRSYVALPWPSLCEADGSVVTIIIERIWQGEKALFPAKIKMHAERPLTDLADDLARALNDPVESIRHFRVLLNLSRFPWPVRRLLWWLAHNIGPLRTAYFGSFGISVLGHLGATITAPVTPLTSTVSYGPFAASGDVELFMTFDHRVMDGEIVARSLARLEEVLNGPIAAELRGLGQRA